MLAGIEKLEKKAVAKQKKQFAGMFDKLADDEAEEKPADAKLEPTEPCPSEGEGSSGREL